MDAAEKIYIKITNEISNHADRFNINLAKGELWYRGEARMYDTTPSTFMRQLPMGGPESSELMIGTYIMMYESWIYEKFSKELLDKFPTLHESLTKNGWDIVYYMQHYGIPTRFIDWTEDLNTALFFATEKANTTNDDSVLWLFTPYEMNKLMYGEEWLKHPAEDKTYRDFVYAKMHGLEQKIGAAISPHGLKSFATRDIERLYSQYGHFVFIPKDYRDMRAYIDKISLEFPSSKDKLLSKIIIPNSKARLVNDYLTSIGCDKSNYKLDKEPFINPSDYTFESLLETMNKK
ncbi:FRG domain-containing protein [Peribacillus simplex]|uniref:FRG domain-containing protein n=1 Tax=Peribacillus simplex TaxID=1478 RepID=A0A9X8RDX5_9BACI|nr:FRG domain-containing protein [Peribacillus simplex]SIS04175.1 FRG domain-containing protein [Peribacillus simplex]